MFALLLKYGFSPFDTNRDGNIALQPLLEKRNPKIFQDSIESLRNRYSDLSRSDDSSDANHNHYPKEKSHPSQSIHPGKPIQWKRDSSGSTFLHKIIQARETDWALELLELVQDGILDSGVLSILDSEGRAPIHHAVSLGLTEVIESILKIDPGFLRTRNGYGQNVCLMACEYDNLGFLEARKKDSPETFAECIQELDSEGNTAFHLAVECDSVETLPFLIGLVPEYGMDWNPLIRNNSGESAFGIAHREKLAHCMKILKKEFTDILLGEIQKFTEWKTYPEDSRNRTIEMVRILKQERILSANDLYPLDKALENI